MQKRFTSVSPLQVRDLISESLIKRFCQELPFGLHVKLVESSKKYAIGYTMKVQQNTNPSTPCNSEHGGVTVSSTHTYDSEHGGVTVIFIPHNVFAKRFTQHVWLCRIKDVPTPAASREASQTKK